MTLSTAVLRVFLLPLALVALGCAASQAVVAAKTEDLSPVREEAMKRLDGDDCTGAAALVNAVKGEVLEPGKDGRRTELGALVARVHARCVNNALDATGYGQSVRWRDLHTAEQRFAQVQALDLRGLTFTDQQRGISWSEVSAGKRDALRQKNREELAQAEAQPSHREWLAQKANADQVLAKAEALAPSQPGAALLLLASLPGMPDFKTWDRADALSRSLRAALLKRSPLRLAVAYESGINEKYRKEISAAVKASAGQATLVEAGQGAPLVTVSVAEKITQSAKEEQVPSSCNVRGENGPLSDSTKFYSVVHRIVSVNLPSRYTVTDATGKVLGTREYVLTTRWKGEDWPHVPACGIKQIDGGKPPEYATLSRRLLADAPAVMAQQIILAAALTDPAREAELAAATTHEAKAELAMRDVLRFNGTTERIARGREVLTGWLGEGFAPDTYLERRLARFAAGKGIFDWMLTSQSPFRDQTRPGS